MTPLQIQAIQTRQFETSKDIAFRAVITVFQDNGYTIQSADMETGLITASSPSQTSVQLFVGNRITATRATATVEEFPAGTAHIRINLVNTAETSSGYGMKSQHDAPVLDSAVYDGLFTRIQEAIFVRSALQN
jgi:hypothetical protein